MLNGPQDLQCHMMKLILGRWRRDERTPVTHFADSTTGSNMVREGTQDCARKRGVRNNSEGVVDGVRYEV